MSFRTIVIQNSAKLDYSLGFLVVRQAETLKIHIADIDTLIIESTAVSLTTSLLAALVKAKVKVVFCDEKRQPSAELLPYYGCHDCSGKLRTQVSWGQHCKDSVWTEIVAEKIRKQMEHLRDLRCPEAVLLEDYLSELTIGDTTNREGHAARVYFSGLFGEDFSRTQDNSINAALNYGYGIILAMIDREIVNCGYSTQLGIFHNNVNNPFNLGSDLMEPFRIIVDRIVRMRMPEIFDHEEKKIILELIKQSVVIDGRVEMIPNAIRIYVWSVLNAINDNDVSLIKFYQFNEL